MKTTKNQIVHHLLQNLLVGNRANCSAIVKQSLKVNPSVLDLYEKVLKSALYEVGHLWEMNQITVATEHMATAITETLLNELLDETPPFRRSNKKVVLASVEFEQHQVGIRMAADVFETKGWESFFLGSGVPTSELVRFIRETKPDLLALSLSVYFNFGSLLKTIEIMRAEFPEIQIIIGGQAFCHLSDEVKKRLSPAVFLPNLYELGLFIDNQNAN